MADYVFIAEPGFDRRILKDKDGNTVFVNSQLEYDYYTADRGGPFNGSYWEDAGSAGIITEKMINDIQPEYEQKQSGGDELVSPNTDISILNLYGPDGEQPIDNDDNDDGSIDTSFGAGSTSFSSWSGRDKGKIPSGAEYWNVNGEYYIVYFIPGSGVPVYYDSSLEDLKNLFGPVEFPEVEASIKSPSSDQWSKAIRFGNSLELADPNVYDPTQSPWVSFIDTVAKEAAIRPWLANEEMVELLAEATLEGRTVTDAEWQSTEWWRGSTQAQRDWLLLAQSGSGDFASDLPADALAKIEDDKLVVNNLMQQMGINNPSDELVAWVSEKLTTGDWTPTYVDEQIKVLADPTLDADMDTDLSDFITSGEIDYDTTRAGESQVKRLVKEYLGPVFGGNIADSQINKWAGMLRNDPDAEIQIKETMLNMKKGLFGEYNDELTYEEIAAPWRGFTTNTWGGTVDETSTLFQDVVKANDVTVANKLLFDAGLKDGGSEKIKQDVLNSLVSSFGGGAVRRII